MIPKELFGCTVRHLAVAKYVKLHILPSTTHPLSGKKKRGRPKIHEVPEKMYIKVCSNCFSRIGSGYPHNDCTSRRSKVSNVENLLSSTPTTAQRVASRVINDTDTPFLATLGNKAKSVSSGSVLLDLKMKN